MHFLKNGTPVFFHSLQREDRRLIEVHFRKLSERSRYHRFMSTRDTIPKDTLDHLMAVDPVDNVAICLLTEEEGVQRGVGLARYTRDKSNPSKAEFAIVVMDEYQHLGAGTILMEALIRRARENDIQTLTGISLPENARLQRLIARFGADIRFDGQLFHLSIDTHHQGELHEQALSVEPMNPA